MARYKVLTDQYHEDGDILSDGCNAILFYNSGNVPAFINHEPLPAGDTISNSGVDFQDQDHSIYQLRFDASGIPVPDPEVIVRRKVYDISNQP